MLKVPVFVACAHESSSICSIDLGDASRPLGAATAAAAMRYIRVGRKTVVKLRCKTGTNEEGREDRRREGQLLLLLR